MKEFYKGAVRKDNWARVFRSDNSLEWLVMPKDEYKSQGLQPDFESLPEVPVLGKVTYRLDMQSLHDAGKSQDVFRDILLNIDNHLDKGEAVGIELEDLFSKRIFCINSKIEKQEFIKQLGLM
jgi:hypothetical protein